MAGSGAKGVFKNPSTLKFKSNFKTPGTNRFKVSVKHGAYKFGSFMHWIFFKPSDGIMPEDTAQTSFAPVQREDAGASVADINTSYRGRTMAASRHLVDGPTAVTRQDVASHQGMKEVHEHRVQPDW